MKGIASLRGYQQGGVTSLDPGEAKRQRLWQLMAERGDTKEENRRRAMAGEEGYATMGPRPSWAERVAAQVRSVPRRINRALQPETAGETAGLVAASMVPGVGEGIDMADIIAGARTGDIPRMGWGAAGLALPFVAGSTMRKVLGRGAKAADELPMDEASRMARAAEMGFDKDVYHGTSVPEEITEFRPSRTGEFGPGIYTTNAADEAAGYTGSYATIGAPLSTNAPRIMPLKIKLENPLRITDPDEFWKRFGKKGATDLDAQEAAIEAGYDGIIMTRPQMKPGVWPPTPMGKTIEHQVVFDPRNIRSRWAAFDPAQAGSADLLAGIAPLLGLGAAGAARRNYVERER